MRDFLIKCCIFLVFTGVSAQKNNSKLYNYFDGLPSDNISFVFTTSTGKLMFCTNKGIVQFDGQRFDLVYPTNQAVLNAFFTNDELFYEDGQSLQSLQFGSQLVHSKIQAKNYMDTDPNNDHFENIYVDSEKRIWSTDFNNVKYIFENRIQYFQLFPGNKNLNIKVEFVEVSKNEIWILTSNKVYRWFNDSIEDISYSFKNELEFKNIVRVKDQIIIATSKKIISYNISTKISHKLHEFQRSIEIKRLYHFENDIYVLTEHQLLRLHDDNLEVIYSNDDLNLESFIYDIKSRNFWLGSKQGLVQIHLPNSAFSTLNFPKKFKERDNFVIDAASFANNQFYLLTSKNQLFLYDGRKLNYRFSLPNSLQVRSLIYKDKLYVTTTKGVYSYDGIYLEKMPLQNYHGNSDIVKSIIVKDEIWLLFKHAPILKFNLLSGEIVNIPFKNTLSFWRENSWNDLLVDKNNNIWLLGWMPKGFGINLLNKEHNTFEDISVESFQNDRSLFVGDYYLNGFDSKKQLYFSAFGGFNIVNHSGKLVKKIDVFSHTIDDTHLSSIITDANENVFFSSKAGLHVYIKKLNKVIKLNTTDGLTSNSLQYAFKLLSNDRLLVGFENKFTIVDLKAVLKNQLQNTFEITKVLINGEVFPTANQLVLQKDQNNISIYFSTFSYLEKSKIFYKYRINEEEWIDLGNQSELMFNYLPPGTYHIQVKATDHLGNEQSKKLSFSILKKPSFTQSTLFYILMGLFSIILIISLFKYSVYRKTKEKHYELKLKDAEMKMLRAQMNPHFMFNTLNSINSYIIQNKTEDASKYLGAFSKLMRNILESSKQQFIPLEQEIKTTKLYLQLEAVRLEHIFDFKIIIGDSVKSEEVFVPPLIVQPFVENAIWHGLRHLTNKKGVLIIRFMIYEEHTLLIEIEDNGIGREKSDELKINRKHQSYGVQITEERIKSLNASNHLIIEDLYDGTIAQGTKISIYLNLEQNDKSYIS